MTRTLALCAMLTALCACGSNGTASRPDEPQADPPPSETGPAAGTSPCAHCTSADIADCITQCLIEQCARGVEACPPAVCRETGSGWTCDAACAPDSTIHYDPANSDEPPCITGSDIEIGPTGDTTSVTDDCAIEAHYSFDCGPT